MMGSFCSHSRIDVVQRASCVSGRSIRISSVASVAVNTRGTIIVSGSLEDLRKLLPPAKTELVQRQPTLEEVFLSIVGKDVR